MSSLDETVEFLFGLRSFGIHLGLERPRRLMAALGNPEKCYPAIHIAGTNGKGSTAVFIAAILRAAGIRVALYTSPHLLRLSERMVADGRPIEDEEVVRYADALRPLIEESGATFFEVTTAIALRYFADQEVDLAIVETGLGGRLDATSVVNPVCTAITNIALEHTQHLGTTVGAIAREKAGILRKDIPCVTAERDCRTLALLREEAQKAGTTVESLDELVPLLDSRCTSAGSVMTANFQGKRLENVTVPLVGRHHVENARLALAVVSLLPDRAVTEAAVREGLASVKWPGRLELLRRSPRLVYDVAHNPAGVDALFTALDDCYRRRRLLCVVALLEEKDCEAILKIAASAADVFFCADIAGHPAFPPDEMCRLLQRLGKAAHAIPDLHEALATAVAEAEPQDLVCVFGSHYIASGVYSFVRS